MSEELDTNNGRHRSEGSEVDPTLSSALTKPEDVRDIAAPTSPSEADGGRSAAVAEPVGEPAAVPLPGPPQGAVASLVSTAPTATGPGQPGKERSRKSGEWRPGVDLADSGQKRPGARAAGEQQRGRSSTPMQQFEQQPANQAQPLQGWGPQSQSPPQAAWPAAAPAESAWVPQGQWGAQPGFDAGPTAAPRRASIHDQSRQHDPALRTGDEVTRQFHVDRQLGVPVTSPRGEQVHPVDQYARASAPAEAAATGVRHELISAATEDASLRAAKEGWRGALNVLGLSLNPGRKEKAHRDLIRRIRAAKPEMYSVAVLTLKGGAGKTTVTSVLGQVFAANRADGVVAIDADPASGDLPLRTAFHPESLSLVDLVGAEDSSLRQRDQVLRFMSTTDTDLSVLASGWRPDRAETLVPADITDVHEIAKHYFSLLLWDSDVNLHSPLVREILDKSNALVLLVQASQPGALAAGHAIDWLRFNGHEGLLARTVLVVNQTTANTQVDMKHLLTVFQKQQIKIHSVPYDKHLDEGLAIDLAKLGKKTLKAFEELAGVVADDFLQPQPPAPVAAGR